MSATTSPNGNSSGRASVPPSGRGSNRPSGRAGVSPGSGAGGAGRDDWAPQRSAGGGQPPRDPGAPGSRPYRGGRPRLRWKRIALLGGIALLVIATIGGISLYGYASGVDKNVKRADAFSSITTARPVSTVKGALNMLLVGSDSRDPDSNDNTANAWRADTLILMHVPADHKSAQLISIPRDLWVTIPRSNSAACTDGTRAKINASFAFGGLPRAVHTVECLTDVHIDNVMAIDFGGFKDVVNALGGVDLTVDQTITSIHKPHRKFTKGVMHMNGDEALDWVRQRKQFARGDFARMQHQQEFLKAIMEKASSSGTLANPDKLKNFIDAVAASLTVDQNFSLLDTALEFRSIGSSNLTFITSPNKGSETISGQSVVVQDHDKETALFKALASDQMAAWMKTNVKTS